MANRLIKALQRMLSRRNAVKQADAAQGGEAAAGPAVATIAEAPAASSGHGLPATHGRVQWLWHVIKAVVIRVYSMGVLLLVAWAGYLAVAYLVNAVFLGAPVPERLLGWEGRSDVAALRSSSAPGLAGPAERAPLRHFHRVEPWFQPDPRNGCTVSGCHDPLPHTDKTKVSAFANFHAMFMACQMCHGPADGGEAAVTWVGIPDANPQEPPAILRLVRYLENEAQQIKSDPAQAHQTIVPLLRSAVATAGHDAALEHLFLQIDTSEPGSPVWRMAVGHLTVQLPSHARGEYGAKLARQTYRQDTGKLKELGRRYLAEPAGSSRRNELQQAIHGSLRGSAAACLSCHGDTPGAVNYEALGYSPKRAKALSQLQLARLMQQIREGEQFFIPRLLESGDAR